MAVRHGLAGQWAKGKADRSFRQVVTIYLVVIFLYGLCLGFFLARHHQWLGWLAFAAGVVLVLTFHKLIERPVRALSKERIRYLRGAQGEGLVGWLLQDLSNDWHVFNGMKLVSNWDIDHVVVGPGGLFCVSTKAWRGLIDRSADGRLTYNNEPTDLLRQTTGQAMHLRDRLQAMLGSDVPFVQPVLAMPFAYLRCSRQQGAVLVVHQEDLLVALEDRRPKLNAPQVDRCAKVLEMLQQSAAHLYRAANDFQRASASATP